MYKLSIVRIFVRDFDAALRFYTETLGIPLAMADAEAGWAQLETGEAQLALEQVAPGDAEGEALIGRFLGVSLLVEDVEGRYAELVSRGVQFLGAPERQAWGGVMAHLSDPDGNVLTLLST